MSSNLVISLLIAKVAAFFGGTALPGLIGLKLNSTLINQIVKKNKLRSIIITGTNGKTTTARLLGSVLSLAKIDYCHNRSGSNLLRGIATTLINQSSLTGKLKQKFAIFEVDEATVPAAIKALRPKIVVITNLSRDQLDRYGEVDTYGRKASTLCLKPVWSWSTPPIGVYGLFITPACAILAKTGRA